MEARLYIDTSLVEASSRSSSRASVRWRESVLPYLLYMRLHSGRLKNDGTPQSRFVTCTNFSQGIPPGNGLKKASISASRCVSWSSSVVRGAMLRSLVRSFVREKFYNTGILNCNVYI